ncbi:DUF4190 domain-containing protein [Verrucomicrobiaceae bacterium R5-34]|uniref:DUF4190 domain-containing protein n=1 Tax=Oceaniferula flava TaxID=2800421 RepID=A0AAE2SD55_9BACT|nr:DUF4190 domain-containing protein [Oceaniferula flavus]MBK1830752.1 DUF4190 domain-containing protein [Verrucomicrobiaceae bacterium R5-34]MBK1856010.1 DUF4190 domain-containing protein [Oceaniferula flavus]MBM1137317.1 DUF4190 domain-containing protein [Oceaniferula flavus]
MRRTSGLAIGSMVCGIVSLFFFALPSPIAIILGHVARSKIKKSEGKLVGKKMALAGLICGYASLLLVAAIITSMIVSHNAAEAKKAADITEEIRRGKEIYALVIKYETDHGKFPDRLSQLVTEGYVGSLDHLQPQVGGNWLYFQGLTSESYESKYFIRSNHYKTVIYVDGSDGDRDLSFTLEPTDFPVDGHPMIKE